jgi:hypothetical protein
VAALFSKAIVSIPSGNSVKGGRGAGVAQWWRFCAVPVANRGHPRAEDVNRLKAKRLKHIKGGE